jgi:hypothetical protein
MALHGLSSSAHSDARVCEVVPSRAEPRHLDFTSHGEIVISVGGPAALPPPQPEGGYSGKVMESIQAAVTGVRQMIGGTWSLSASAPGSRSRRPAGACCVQMSE